MDQDHWAWDELLAFLRVLQSPPVNLLLSYEFDIQAQLCADPAQIPVENVTIEWPEQLPPFVTVAKLRFAQQDISDDANLEKMDGLFFTPWRVTAEHAPLGNIMRVRKEVYRHSSILRHQLNRQQRIEPSSADEVLTAKLDTPRS